MSKMRSDCVFSKLTPEQADLLEGWLFEENLSYKDALERAQKEFGIGGSLTGLRRFYGRLAKERNKENLADAMSACVAAASLGDDEVLRAGLLSMANVCAVQLLMEPPKDIRQFTALLRAWTSAQAQEMRRIKFEQGEGRQWRSRVIEEARKRKQEEENRQSMEANEEPGEENEARPKARDTDEKETAMKVKSAAFREPELPTNLPTPHPGLMASQARHESVSPEETSASRHVVPVEGRGSGSAQAVEGSVLACESGSVSGDGAKRKSGAAVIVPLKAA